MLFDAPSTAEPPQRNPETRPVTPAPAAAGLGARAASLSPEGTSARNFSSSFSARRGLLPHDFFSLRRRGPAPATTRQTVSASTTMATPATMKYGNPRQRAAEHLELLLEEAQDRQQQQDDAEAHEDAAEGAEQREAAGSLEGLEGLLLDVAHRHRAHLFEVLTDRRAPKNLHPGRTLHGDSLLRTVLGQVGGVGRGDDATIVAGDVGLDEGHRPSRLSTRAVQVRWSPGRTARSRRSSSRC